MCMWEDGNWFLWTLKNNPSSSLNIHYHSPFVIFFFVCLFVCIFFLFLVLKYLSFCYFLDFLYFMCMWEDGMWFLWTLKNDPSSSLNICFHSPFLTFFFVSLFFSSFCSETLFFFSSFSFVHRML